jgi:hypothetical protein
LTETTDCCAPALDPEASGAPRNALNGVSGVGAPLVEIFYFDGCPNHHPALAMVERVSRELGIEPEIRLVNVPDDETARQVRFLGSPTIRVDGQDVDPDTAERDDFGLSCRVFRTDSGIVGQPEERWVRDALRGGVHV